MLRPTSRRPRRMPGALVAAAFIVLAMPGQLLATGSQRDVAGTLTSAAERRAPAVEGRGVARFDVGRGTKPSKPLQILDLQASARPNLAPAAPAPAAPENAPLPSHATLSSAPAVTSFGPWDGLDRATAAGICPTGQSCAIREPPDPIVAVGPDDIVQSVESDFKFTNREGTETKASVDAWEFFDLSNFEFLNSRVTIDGVSDPRWIYDAKHDRWLAIALGWSCDVGTSLGFIFGALSTSGNPTGGYYRFSVKYNGFLPSDPRIGTSADKITFTANEYELPATTTCVADAERDTPSSITFMWSNLQATPATPLNHYEIWGDSPSNFFAPRPSSQPKGSSNTVFGVLAEDAAVGTSNVGFFTISGTMSGPDPDDDHVVIATTDVSDAEVVAPFKDPPAPVQPGGTLGSALTRYPTTAVWQDNVLTFGSTYPCDPPGGAGGENRDCARVTQLDTSTATPTRLQDVLISSTGKDTWAPSAIQSQNGAVHAVFTQSSTTGGMSSYSRYQLPSDPLNAFSPGVELANGGSTSYTGSRWGDFTGLAQDPRDTNAVWQGNQYTKSDGTWATKVSELQTEGSTFVPIDPIRLLDTRVNNGVTGALPANVPRTVVIAGRGGIPDDAVAITANLTVTGQQAAGYFALTPAPTANPSTSTLNFPTKDVRANNVTTPLSAAGGVSVVYKAVAGKAAHAVLDITGYFLDGDTGATYNVLDPLRVLDTRANTGINGAVSSGVPATFAVAGVGGPDGVPPNATAVTGNLTVTNQTAAGYLTLSTIAPVGVPPTSTLNFPVGDVRANGVTIKLSEDPDPALDGRLAITYTSGATGSASTHVVFDVTGYYVDDLTGSRFVAITPGRRMDTRFAAPREGLTGPFVANIPRSLIIEPYQGVPANATAITGNLTVVGQTKAGYVALTPVATATPSTSTLNFPVGDIRANGVTGPLGGRGAGLVLKAGSGSTTHLLLDLTGYFR